ncbi:MAG: 4-(cytidine 5'-diphospho)-2-C-methyl-D-erythritol kinase [Alphaproteobacteria bacterium]|nr:4-(cytidine 5'-diphospho)-2-C-methyl-D-erythritol kinase [Alphaproteobacteria bacterium]
MTDLGPAVLHLSAPAKINLYLHVTGRRADGYHLLDSLIAFTGLADSVELGPGRDFEITIDGPFADAAGPPDDNLALRAARALARAAGVDAGARIRLTKQIPAAAGLGGGSADAAAVLAGFMRLWDVPDGVVDLAAIGLRLGADVPACLAGRPVFVGGIGEEIADAPRLPAAGVLLVNPGVAVSTSSVFAGRRGGFSAVARFASAPSSTADLAAILDARSNDLTEASCRLVPVLEDVLSAIRAAPGCRLARMSGSGATCFGLFDDEAAALAALPAVRRGDWWAAATALA